MIRDEIAGKAKATLLGNWKGSYSVPSNRLYPFQWNWDSGFVAIGFSLFRPDFAMAEMRSLFEAQWSNGMLPHIVFHDVTKKDYFPNYEFWGTDNIPEKPPSIRTSGITQPPVHGFVLEILMERLPESTEKTAFFHWLFPRIKALHANLYADRDPSGEGLVFIYHPWETGRDNSPLWTPALQRIQLTPQDIPPYRRIDNTIANPEERPTSFDYDRYVYLIDIGKKCGYDGKRIARESPFLIQDAMFNALLIRSNEALINLGKTYGLPVDDVVQWQQKSKTAFESKLWSDRIQTYCSYDMVAGELIEMPEIGGLCALFGGSPTCDRAAAIARYMEELASGRSQPYWLCPSFDPDHALFNPKKYWQGPVWPQMNWLLSKGLHRYGYDVLAARLATDLLELLEQYGFYEYFDPRKNLSDQLTKGYGGGDFSWTSAVALDLLDAYGSA